MAIYTLEAVPGKNILLGGGLMKRAGWIVWDLHAPGADIKHDLNTFPYPLKDNSVAQIEATQIFEHLHDWRSALFECHRILERGGKILIQVPHYMGVYSWSHFDHKAAFCAFSMEPFISNPSKHFLFERTCDAMVHEKPRFELSSRMILFPKGIWFWGWILERIFNMSEYLQLFHELWLSGIFKPSGVLFVLKKI